MEETVLNKLALLVLFTPTLSFAAASFGNVTINTSSCEHRILKDGDQYPVRYGVLRDGNGNVISKTITFSPPLLNSSNQVYYPGNIVVLFNEDHTGHVLDQTGGLFKNAASGGHGSSEGTDSSYLVDTNLNREVTVNGCTVHFAGHVWLADD